MKYLLAKVFGSAYLHPSDNINEVRRYIDVKLYFVLYS